MINLIPNEEKKKMSREFYFRLLKGKGHGKALVAVARKMLVGIYFVLKENKEFCPN